MNGSNLLVERIEDLRVGFVVSHPSDKNKYVARMGHPLVVVSWLG